MATRFHSTNDINNDELFARNLQDEEENRSKLNTCRTRAAHFRSRFNEHEGPIQVIQNDEEDDIIVIDDDGFIPIESPSNRREVRTPPKDKRTQPSQEDTNNDELLARRLQEEYDKELANSLSRAENRLPNYNLRRANSNSAVPASTNPSNYNFRTRDPTNRIPESFATEMLFNMARDQNTRTNQNASNNNTSNDLDSHIFLNTSRNGDPALNLANAFNFLHNRNFMEEFLAEDNQPNQNRTRNNTNTNTGATNNINNSNNTNNTQINNNRPTGRVQHSNRFYRNLNPNSIPRPRGRQNNFFNLMTVQGDFTADDYESLLRLDEVNAVKKCLSRQEIDSLPAFEFKENNESPEENTCSICFEVYVKKEKLTSLACFHKFHKNCIKEWLKQSRQCPLCKKDAINGN